MYLNKNSKIRIFGDSTQIHEYVFISNTSNALSAKITLNIAILIKLDEIAANPPYCWIVKLAGSVL